MGRVIVIHTFLTKVRHIKYNVQRIQKGDGGKEGRRSSTCTNDYSLQNQPMVLCLLKSNEMPTLTLVLCICLEFTKHRLSKLSGGKEF